MMKRIISLVVVALVMAAMVAMSAPAFAAPPTLESNPNSNSQGNTGAQASSLSKHNGPVVSQQAQSGQRSELVHACKAQPDPTACG